jgi:phospholipase C
MRIAMLVLFTLGCVDHAELPASDAAEIADAGPVKIGPLFTEDMGDDDEPEQDGLDGGPEVDDGARPDASLLTPIPSKIRYVLVLVKENHTFDNYFTGFPGAESSKTAKLSTGATLTRPAAPTGALPRDICHSNSCGQKAWRNGSMAGFDLLVPSPNTKLPFDYYSEKQIPNYWQYARSFVLADHFFSTTMGPSTPGHIVFWMAQSPVLDNPKCTRSGGTGCTGTGCTADSYTKVTSYDPDTCSTKTVAPCFNKPILVDHLPQGFTWIDYGGSLALMDKNVAKLPNYQTHFRKQGALLTDLQADHVANLMIAHLWSGDTSEHPPAYPCVGENQTVEIINAAMQTPEWNEMAIVITWDDWGGFYDHVAPKVHKCANGQVFNEGFRLPAILVSPYAKEGYVLKTVTEQASVPKLIEDLWGMDYMSTRDPHARDGSAGSLMDAFDFTQPPRAPLLLSTRTCP